jgi:HAD superfamily hydrolase (TIGR01484 family)
MKNLNELNKKNIKFIFTDIDDTLTHNGLLEAEAYQSIWDLHRKGFNVIPVTGRPAGWCELIARQWPVKGVIGENGGFYFYYSNNKMNRKFHFEESQRLQNQKKLEVIKNEVLKNVPGSGIASDQFCRLMDLAIDFCEDVKPLPEDQVQKIVDIFKKFGATAKISSIHVNGWFGDYDKLSMCKIFSQEVLGINLDSSQDQILFVGDSPNDEPMFFYFKNSIGVSNVRDFKLLTPPQFVTHLPRGKGFQEITKHLLS